MSTNNAKKARTYRRVVTPFAHYTCICALVVSGLISSSLQADDDWPRWRGSAFDGTADAHGVFADSLELKVRWKTKLGSGYSGIVIASRRVVTMFSDGDKDYVVALDGDSGQEIWRLAIAPTWPGRDGAADGPTSTPAIDRGIVYALGPRGDLLAIDISNGKLRWKKQLVELFDARIPHWGFGTSPLVVGELLIVMVGGDKAALVAFDRKTGELVWRVGSDEVNYQSPILMKIDGKEQIVAAGNEWLYGVEPSTGNVRWKHQHGGRQFHAKIINPVIVDGQRLLLNNRPGKSTLVQLGSTETSGMVVTDEWSSSALKANYAPPLHHEGFLYGYSGNYMSCIRANDGQLIWKSRPPGNGFTILVDGHIVTMAKDGSLHVASATPTEYKDKARLDLFSNLTWTPPSFANGRIYARDSIDSIACIEAVETSPLDIKVKSNAPGQVLGTKFQQWVEQLQHATNKKERIESFLAKQSEFPIVEGETLVHLVYQGSAKDMAVRLDMFDTTVERSMHRVDGTDFFYYSFETDPDARLQYQFVRDFGESITDPLNPRSAGSLRYPPKPSLLLMPKSDRRGFSLDSTTVLAGRLESVPFDTEKTKVGELMWGGRREIQVYLPPGYDKTSIRYPTVYVLYGKRMLKAGRMGVVLDRLIGSEVAPLIAVFVPSISGYEYARTQRDIHERMMAEKVIPLIDERFRTMPDPRHRAVLGADEAAFAAIQLGFRYPAKFGKVAALSVFPVGEGGESLLENISKSPRLPLEIYLDWGRYDMRNRSVDVAAYGNRLRDRLESKGYDISGRQWNDGSDVAIWGRRAMVALKGFFPSNDKPAVAP